MKVTTQPATNTENVIRGSSADTVAPMQDDVITRLIANASIMMVDDEQLNMDVLQIHLENEGYRRFTSINDSRKAMQGIYTEMPDVLLLDLVMPEVSGFEILAEIRKDSRLAQLPVIVLTSADDADTKHRALTLGATDFLAKPIDASELALRMRNTLTARAWLERRHRTDDLTGLPNRAFFADFLGHRLTAAREQNARSAVVLVNIDRFKSINDSLGPSRGDEILRDFSRRLRKESGCDNPDVWADSDAEGKTRRMLARLDGDRFAVWINLPDEKISVEQAIVPELDKLIDMLKIPFVAGEQQIYLSLCMGVSTLDSETTSIDALINHAETAMLYSKSRSTERYAFYSSHMDARARQLLSLENGLRTAIENNELFVVYQPKVSLPSNVIGGAEALVRWNHPEFGLIPPPDFIPMAENSGIIVEIGEWILHQAARQTVKWQQSLYPDFNIAVNVSVRQLHDPGFFDMVLGVVEQSGLAPESLTIELTENMIMEDVERNVAILEALKGLGISISIDDFGTGYSSLSYLRKFPVDQLKIDRSFICEIQHEDDYSPIVKAVTSLAHDLGLSVVAEGIETVEQMNYVRELSCEKYQGFFCSQPLIAEEFEQLLKEDLRKAG